MIAIFSTIMLLLLAGVFRGLVDLPQKPFAPSVYIIVSNKKENSSMLHVPFSIPNSFPKSWEYKNADSRKGEAFWLSSSLLRWTVSFYHFANMIWLNCFTFAMVINISWFDWYWEYLILRAVFGLGFSFSNKWALSEGLLYRCNILILWGIIKPYFWFWTIITKLTNKKLRSKYELK